MEITTAGNPQMLQFCKTCGDLRVKEVKAQLQKLFTTKSVPDDVCSLCYMVLSAKDIQVTVRDIKDSYSPIKSEPSNEPDDDSDDVDDTGTLHVPAVSSDSQSSVISFKTEGEEKKHYNLRQVETRYGRKASVAIIRDDTADDEDPSNEPPGVEVMSSDVDHDDNDEVPESDGDLSSNETDTKPHSARTSKPKTRNGLNPKLLDMMKPETADSKRPFSCKFCTEEFGQVLGFQRHIQTHTGEEPLENPYFCAICKIDFPSRERYDIHESKHSGVNRYVCSHKGCKKSFPSSSAFSLHRRSHSKHRPFKCKFCQKGFITYSQQVIHERYHTGERRFKCNACGKAFHLKRSLLDHETIHSGEKPFQCNLCPYQCRLERMLITHQVIHLRRSYRCERCLHVFSHKFRYDKHRKLNKCKTPKPKLVKVKVESSKEQTVDIDITYMTNCLDPEIVEFMDTPKNVHKPFKCKNCKRKQFRSVGSFIKHVCAHMSQGYQHRDKPYNCSECGYRAKSMHALDMHKVAHAVVRPFKCNRTGCDATFKSENHMKTHVNNVHLKIKKFICEICARAFNNSTKLAMHVATHSNEKPIQCSSCDKRFRFEYQLKRHDRRIHNHSGIMVMCEQCGKNFKSRDDLRTHSIIHTGLKPFPCTMCSYRCNRKDNLRKHMKIHTESSQQRKNCKDSGHQTSQQRKKSKDSGPEVDNQVHTGASALLLGMAHETVSATTSIAPVKEEIVAMVTSQMQDGQIHVQEDPLPSQNETVNAVTYVLNYI